MSDDFEDQTDSEILEGMIEDYSIDPNQLTVAQFLEIIAASEEGLDDVAPIE